MTSYQVKFWDVKKIGDTAKGRWRVRWAVAGREHCKSFAARPLADGFLTDLKNAAHARQPFDETTGLPAQPGHAAAPRRSWYDHARGYAEMKWPHLATTQRRKRAVFYNAVGYAVEQRLLGANPVDRIQWKAPDVAETVDRRVVASPAQARALLTGVRAHSSRGQHLEAFYGCLYYAALRPSEAVALRETDCHLPSRGWGRIDLAASEPRAGRDWTDHGTARQARGLKHRAEDEMRSIPIPPALVALLRAHLKTYDTTPDGRLFRTARGGALQDSAYSAVWQAARTAVFTPAQHASPLARRPYDLRHAAVSLWLNSGVPATEVARRAGHSVAVLLKVYAHCIDGQADTVNKRIAGALGGDEETA